MEIVQKGSGYEECVEKATEYAQEKKIPFMKAFDHMTLF